MEAIELAKNYDLGFPYIEVILILLILVNILTLLIEDRTNFLKKNLIISILFGLLVLGATLNERFSLPGLIETPYDISELIFLKILLDNLNKLILVSIFIIVNQLVSYFKLRKFRSRKE